jgi:hypothetical protein
VSETIPCSQEPWVDRLCRDALARTVPLLESKLAPHGLRGIVLGGSASLGEAVGWKEGGLCFVLSDLDLGIVTDHSVPPAERAALQDQVRRASDPKGPEPALGFYESRFLGLQDPTLGLVDLRERGRVLIGGSGLLARFTAPSMDAIPSWEALRLLGNRALELLRAPNPNQSDHADRARAWYAAAKLGTAPWTARLVTEGRYRVGWRARRVLLEDAPDDAVTRAARLWGPFLEHPSPASLPSREMVLSSLRAGLVGFSREAGYWPDAPEAPSGIAGAYLREPATLRRRIRAWRGVERGWALRSRMRGTPEGRRLAASVLYWLCAMENPEPHWGDWGGAPDMTRWDRETAGLLAHSVAAGSGGRARLLAALTR